MATITVVTAATMAITITAINGESPATAENQQDIAGHLVGEGIAGADDNLTFVDNRRECSGDRTLGESLSIG